MSLGGELLERAARATPATVEDRSTGWLLRHTDGSAWWAGAVLAHDAADQDATTGRGLADRIAAAEQFYAEHRAKARFQVCDGCPPGLDAMLAERGYRRESPISLRVASRERLVVPPEAFGLEVRVVAEVDEAWLAVLRSTPEAPVNADYEARLLRRVRLPSAYVTVFGAGEPVAIGRAVADDGWTGVFGMFTAPMARRRGAASQVLAAITNWASEHDTPRLYLQVEKSNVAATHLYAVAGFSEIATYHYRVKNAPAELRNRRLDPEAEVQEVLRSGSVAAQRATVDPPVCGEDGAGRVELEDGR